MLAYVFWHRPAAGVLPGTYEEASERFHRSLGTQPPGGFVASVCLRAEDLPWLAGGGPGYEDWYVVEDFAALGVLGEAAVGRGHLTAHDAAARLSGEGAGGVYRLLDGVPSFADVRLASWITPPRAMGAALLADFLADGIDPARASLWRRQLVLGPAPELCLLSARPPDGVSATRLPAHWHELSAIRAAVLS